MRFIDSYAYAPNFWQKILSFTLLPLSLLYGVCALLRRRGARLQSYGLPIVSVGNLIVGGSGKTPFIIEVAREFERVAVISRGYGRKSKGLVVVSEWGRICCGVEEGGDEPSLIARELPNASVIVCKDRQKAIRHAQQMGARVIFLDDGFRFRFQKLSIVLRPRLEPYFRFCLPSGIYREFPSAYSEADLIVREGEDYRREVQVELCQNTKEHRLLLLTAIANPARLEEFLPEVVGKITLRDHASFDVEWLRAQMSAHNATSLLVTSKDEVKLLESGLPLSVLRLRLEIDSRVLECVRNYVKSFQSKE